ncbi:AUGMIN subunit 2-like [Gigantopelta aegis]|uniref:AUGMIN subunit 2-like n=1 Tax=Gigantopelta aegis TaxID=1735272 RepID=UPI001B88CC3A|nr:AUGMIN subunit 2-like [Gigantopelta aegis]
MDSQSMRSVHYDTSMVSNPWAKDSDTVIAWKNCLVLAEKTGFRPSSSSCPNTSTNHEDLFTPVSDWENQDLPSLRLIALQRKITDLRKENHRIQLEIQRRMQDREIRDITHLDVLENKIQMINTLSVHIELIIQNKDRLIRRLQEPFVGEFIKLDAEYHKYASMLFSQITPVLSDLNQHLDNIRWASTIKLDDGKLDNTLSQISSLFAMLQTHCHSLLEMRDRIGQIKISH